MRYTLYIVTTDQNGTSISMSMATGLSRWTNQFKQPKFSFDGNRFDYIAV